MGLALDGALGSDLGSRKLGVPPMGLGTLGCGEGRLRSRWDNLGTCPQDS